MASGTEKTLLTLVSRNADRIKAILIIIVVADHNDWLRNYSPNFFEPLTLHVLGFFLLSFSFSTKTWSSNFVLDRIARYLIPFWWVLAASSLAFSFTYKFEGGISDYFSKWVLAALIGNAPFVKSSSGLMMLWFLPCLFGLSCLLAIFDSLKSNSARYVAISLAVVAHLAIPLMLSTLMLSVPFGLAIAADIFILGLIWRKLLNLRLPKYWGPIALAFFIAAYSALVWVPVHLEIATLSLAGISNPAILLLQDISGMAGVLSVVWLTSQPRQIQWLENIGRNSLLIYLLHPFIYVLIGKLFALSRTAPPLDLLLVGLITNFTVVGLAYLMASFVSRVPLLSEWFTPRSLRQWPPIRLLCRPTQPK